MYIPDAVRTRYLGTSSTAVLRSFVKNLQIATIDAGISRASGQQRRGSWDENATLLLCHPRVCTCARGERQLSERTQDRKDTRGTTSIIQYTLGVHAEYDTFIDKSTDLNVFFFLCLKQFEADATSTFVFFSENKNHLPSCWVQVQRAVCSFTNLNMQWEKEQPALSCCGYCCRCRAAARKTCPPLCPLLPILYSYCCTSIVFTGVLYLAAHLSKPFSLSLSSSLPLNPASAIDTPQPSSSTARHSKGGGDRWCGVRVGDPVLKILLLCVDWLVDSWTRQLVDSLFCSLTHGIPILHLSPLLKLLVLVLVQLGRSFLTHNGSLFLLWSCCVSAACSPRLRRPPTREKKTEQRQRQRERTTW